MKRVICYLNQFFGGVGGEERADLEPYIVEGCIGPAALADSMLEAAKVTHTIVCGDNFMASHTQEALDTIGKLIENIPCDMFMAGPAFRAGRYGVACGNVCKMVKERRGIPAISSMNEENPGVDMFRKDVIIFRGSAGAAKMRGDVSAMAAFADRMLSGGRKRGAREEGYFERGLRSEKFLEFRRENTAAYRGVNMLIRKMRGESYETELPIPVKETVSAALPLKDLSQASIAMVTSGGIVPQDNPDRIQSASATRWGRYDISGMNRLEAGAFKTIHAGFDPTAANLDPNVILPLDAMRLYEEERRIGKLDDHFYSTVGTGTTEAEARRMAKEIVPFLKKDAVDAIILVST